jgi:hypothetical protein
VREVLISQVGGMGGMFMQEGALYESLVENKLSIWAYKFCIEVNLIISVYLLI